MPLSGDRYCSNNALDFFSPTDPFPNSVSKLTYDGVFQIDQQ